MTHHHFLDIVAARGFLDNCTHLDALGDHLQTPQTGYIGYDATATSLHVGHLLNIVLLRWFQNCGHTPIVLLGGATTLVGDPSFRSDARPMLTEHQINDNITSLKRVFEPILDQGPLHLSNNLEWTKDKTHLDFLRNVGQHFSVNRMLSFESVKSRLADNGSLSFLEFSYMLLQANDFLELFERQNCRLQMGGSDQWGNILNGTDLIRKKHGQTAFGLTTPLLTKSNGQKMGKSQDGAVWLNPELCNPFDFWQFWRNTDDEDVERFLKLFTFLPLEQISELTTVKGKALGPAKNMLANEVTALVHGATTAQQCCAAAQSVFGHGKAENLPEILLENTEFPMTFLELLRLSGLESSGKACKRLIDDGGARLDGEKILESNKILTIQCVDGKRLSKGKKQHVKMVVKPPSKHTS